MYCTRSRSLVKAYHNVEHMIFGPFDFGRVLGARWPGSRISETFDLLGVFTHNSCPQLTPNGAKKKLISSSLSRNDFLMSMVRRNRFDNDRKSNNHYLQPCWAEKHLRKQKSSQLGYTEKRAHLVPFWSAKNGHLWRRYNLVPQSLQFAYFCGPLAWSIDLIWSSSDVYAEPCLRGQCLSWPRFHTTWTLEGCLLCTASLSLD